MLDLYFLPVAPGLQLAFHPGDNVILGGVVSHPREKGYSAFWRNDRGKRICAYRVDEFDAFSLVERFARRPY